MLIRVNGRLRFYRRVNSVVMIRRGHWRIESSIGTFEVEGGKAAGGAGNEWYLSGFGNKAIYFTSLIAALREIEKA